MKRKTAEYLMRAEKISSLCHKSSEDASGSMVGFNLFFFFSEPESGVFKMSCLLAKHIRA